MTVFPVIVRELRAQSRQPLTYWLRVLAAGTVVAVFGIFLWRPEEEIWITSGLPIAAGTNPFSEYGAMLFGQLNATLFLCNALLAPILTADCISREKREGTLGLLFLTKLSATGIVTGKSFVHALRGVTLFAAMLPALTIPILLGGVSAQDCLIALLIDSIVLILGLAAGLLASALNRDWRKSVAFAECFSVAFVGMFMFSHAGNFEGLSTIAGSSVLNHGGSLLDELTGLFRLHTNFGLGSSYVAVWGAGGPVWRGTFGTVWGSLPPSVHSEWLRLLLGHLASTVIFLFAIITLAALRLRKSWRREPAHGTTKEIWHSLTRKRFAVGFLRRRLARSLDRNPIGWLHQYSWKARLIKWVLFASIMFIESLLAADPWDFADAQPWVFLVFLLGLAFAAAGSFRNERESGALELLLVCPLRINQIIAGRLRGIWMQSLPSVLLLALCVSIAAQIAREGYDRTASYAMMTAAVFSVPMLGLFFSMCRLNFLAAWIFTIVLGIFVPFMFLSTGLLGLLSLADSQIPALIFFEAGTGVLCWILLSYRLKTRRFLISHA